MALTTSGTACPRATGLEGCRGWPREFEQEALRHREHLHRRALGLCRNVVDAEDLVQETYLRAFRFFDQFTPGTNCRAWLLTILRNAFVGRATRDAREVLGRDESEVQRAADRQSDLATTPEHEFFQHVISDPRLAKALDGLSRRFREVLILADLEGRSYREIAQMCEMPIGTVMSRLFRAHRLLRKALRDRPGPRRPLVGGDARVLFRPPHPHPGGASFEPAPAGTDPRRPRLRPRSLMGRIARAAAARRLDAAFAADVSPARGLDLIP
ncbi:MAG: sigma-70 family RNA polymerase sigma factor [Candidatus Rokuibacteriota bacterium]